MESAVRMLSIREHSRKELQAKLLKRRYQTDLVEQVIDDLLHSSLLSDARFAENFIASRVAKGQGPVRIRNELQERGVAKSYVSEFLAPFDDQWTNLLKDVHDAKYGRQKADTQKERVRRARFLESRGFPRDLIQRILFE
jgi:regulatory protein